MIVLEICTSSLFPNFSTITAARPHLGIIFGFFCLSYVDLFVDKCRAAYPFDRQPRRHFKYAFALCPPAPAKKTNSILGCDCRVTGGFCTNR